MCVFVAMMLNLLFFYKWRNSCLSACGKYQSIGVYSYNLQIVDCKWQLLILKQFSLLDVSQMLACWFLYHFPNVDVNQLLIGRLLALVACPGCSDFSSRIVQLVVFLLRHICSKDPQTFHLLVVQLMHCLAG